MKIIPPSVEKETIISLFHQFIKDSEVTIFNNDNVNCEKILHLYFKEEPPFENKELKKHEFPDAIMGEQLKTMFTGKNPVYVISNDNGFRNMFKNETGFITYDSLKKIFDLINQENKIIYEHTKLYFSNPEYHDLICKEIESVLLDKNLYVDGEDYDQDGICEGYDYDDVDIEEIFDVDFRFESIDNIDMEHMNITLTLSCTATIVAGCSYFDENNSIWDSEDKRYIISVTGQTEEKHKPNFECEVSCSIEENGQEFELTIESIDCDFTLDQDTRISRKIVDNNLV